MTDIPPEIVEALVVLLTALASYMAYRTRTNTGSIKAIEEKVEQQIQTTAIIDTTSVTSQWSNAAKEAMDKAIPPASEIIKVDDGPGYHIVYWRVKK